MLSPFATAAIDGVHPTATVVSRRECRAVPAGAAPGASRSWLAMDTTRRLTEILGRPVVDRSGTRLGRVTDLLVDHAERYPRVTAVSIDRRRTVTVEPWSSVVRLERELVLEPSGEPAAGDLHLARDLLDAQVVDIAGQRLARVGEIELVQRGSELLAVAVDVGLAPVVRRLGLRRLSRRLHDETIGWEGLHFATGRGHHVQLASPAAAVHRLEPHELMAVVSRLPPEREAEVLAAVPADRAERARRIQRRPRRRRFRVMRARKRAPS
jgi:sporulation protein YlmC with PRC-barrel domain